MSDQDQIVLVPDIGTDDTVDVIEVNVGVGDTVEQEDTLITLESEKASMEIPAPYAGVVKEILIKVGDKVSTGSQIIIIQAATVSNVEHSEVKNLESESTPQVTTTVQSNQSTQPTQVIQESQSSQSSEPTTIAVTIPDIGTDDKVDVIEIQVKPGDSVAQEDALVTLESDKASMDIPAPKAGIVSDIVVKVGDKVGFGDLVLYLEVAGTANGTVNQSQIEKPVESQPQSQSIPQAQTQPPKSSTTNISNTPSPAIAAGNKHVYASPSVRRFASDLGVELSKVSGTGRKGRVLKEDVEHYVKQNLAKVQSGQVGAASSSVGSGLGLAVASLPQIDFAKFGEVTEKPLKRIQKLSAANLHRNWVVVPHVTQFDEADITDMEGFRQKYKKQAQEKGYSLTPLVFLMRAAAQALKLMPQFNVSLSNDGENLIQKHYFHIGIAVDTPNGLVVPVIRDVDQKGLFQLAAELAEVSQKARDGKLQAKDMQGGCFSISSLGGIGGTAFTPIVNVPDVAILGVSKSQMKPIYQNGEFVPRLMLPLSLSYDHRAIDGADAARFITLFSQLLGDISQLLL